MDKVKNTENNSSPNTKQCKKCRSFIDKKAKKCPNCGSKQGLPIWAIILIVIVAIGVLSSLGKDDSSHVDNNGSANNSNNGSSQVQQPIEYIKVSKDDLDEALDNNAAAAKDTYNKKYVEVTGRLGTIDSDLKYISLMSSTEEWDIIGIHCTIKNNEQKEIVKTLTKDQSLTIRGKITDVGEVLGYYLDITEIIPN